MTDAAKIAKGLTKAQREAVLDGRTGPVEWKDVPGYEGCYSISDQGEVISLPRMMIVRKPGVKPYHVPAGGKVLKRTHSRKGYPQIGLSKNGVNTTKELHRLVCETFHGSAPERCEAAHINGDKTDARAVNLAWVTRAENHRHKREHGTLLTGEAVPNSKITAMVACAIVRRKAAGEPMRAIAREYGINERAVRKIVRGEMWADQTIAVRAELERIADE